MSKGLVSVIVPTYNRAYCLRRTIDSALAQTYPHLEVIVVDDGSSDGTAELIRATYGLDERVRYFPQPNRGAAAARNRGISLARGEYIALLDSDDAWKPWKLQIQVACLGQAPEVGMVWTDMEAVDPQGRVFHRNYLRKMYHAYRWFSSEQLFTKEYPLAEVAPNVAGVPAGGKFYVGDIFSQMVMGNLVHTSTVVLRRGRAERVNGFNEDWRLGEDYDYHLRTCREGPVGFIDLESMEYTWGLSDHITLTHAELCSVNCLRTVTRTLREDGARISLPQWMLRTRLGEVNAWAGRVMADKGNYSGARRHLAKSLAHMPWQPRTMAMLALCCLPRGAGGELRRLYRAVKRCFRPRKRTINGKVAGAGRRPAPATFPPVSSPHPAG
jgi:glycosyltransferase involved in cell wall biosynthesis